MSLSDPVNENEEYINLVRLYMERMFGENIKSVCMADVEFRHPESDEVHTIDIIRFQTHFPIKLPMDFLPYLDLYIDPVDKFPRISLFGKNNFSTLLDEPIHPKELEHLFASLIWGAEFTKKGLQVAVKNPSIQ